MFARVEWSSREVQGVCARRERAPLDASFYRRIRTMRTAARHMTAGETFTITRERRGRFTVLWQRSGGALGLFLTSVFCALVLGWFCKTPGLCAPVMEATKTQGSSHYASCGAWSRPVFRLYRLMYGVKRLRKVRGHHGAHDKPLTKCFSGYIYSV